MLSGRHKVKKMAVENFLMSLGDLTEQEAIGNMYLDANLYRWNRETMDAIRKGIQMAAGK